MSNKIILLFSLALDKTNAGFKISFAGKAARVTKVMGSLGMGEPNQQMKRRKMRKIRKRRRERKRQERRYLRKRMYLALELV